MQERGGALERQDDIVYPAAVPFVLVHLACLAAIWTGVRAVDVGICLALYVVRMFAVTAGYHRYFSHRSFKLGRAAQFALAVVCQTSTQKSVLWWAAKHRHHHKYSDTPEDVHSPRQFGFWFSHVGWIFAKKRGRADFAYIPDLLRFRELVWLDRFELAPAIALAVALFWLGGWPTLIVGFFWSTVLLAHGTFFINSMAHVLGRQRYVTGDDSRNNFWLALITFGEGWHNNHHFYQGATRQGFFWWEIDLTYYVLKLWAWTGLAWDLREPPAAVVKGEVPLPRSTVEKVARQLAAAFPVEPLTARLTAAWPAAPALDDLRRRATELRARAAAIVDGWQAPQMPSLPDLGAKLAEARAQIEAYVARLELPELPTRDELRRRAEAMFAKTPSLDEIVARARELLLARLVTELAAEPAPA